MSGTAAASDLSSYVLVDTNVAPSQKSTGDPSPPPRPAVPVAPAHLVAVDRAMARALHGVNWDRVAVYLRHAAEQRKRCNAERREVVGNLEWRRTNAVRVTKDGVAADLSSDVPPMSSVLGVTIYVGHYDDVPAVHERLLSFFKETPSSQCRVSVVILEGLCSVVLLHALTKLCGRSLRILDLSMCVGISSLALNQCLRLPQLHQLSLLVAVPDLPLKECCARPSDLEAVFRGSIDATVVHLRLFGLCGEGAAGLVETCMRSLPYLQRCDAYFLQEAPKTLPLWWKGLRHMTFLGPVLQGWAGTVGVEMVHCNRPDNGPVMPWDPNQWIVPV